MKTDNPVEITISTKRIYVKIPKNDTDTHFLTSFRYVHWDKSNRQWIVPHYGKNLELLQNYFEGRPIIIRQETEQSIQQTGVIHAEKGEFIVRNYQNRQLRIYMTYNRELITTLKQFPLCSWNSRENCWTLPFSEQNLKNIQEIAYTNQLKWKYAILSKTQGSPRLAKTGRSCPEEYIQKLRELRYTDNTLAVYTDMFEEFITYFAGKALNEITEEEIVTYLRYLVFERKVSTSYQNQAINAIKFYYERVLGGKRKMYLIERPRKENLLP